MNRNFALKSNLPRLLALLIVPACTSVASNDIKTAGMTAGITVSADGTGASVVNAHINVDTNATDFVNLSPGDTLSAKAGTQTQPMTSSTLLGAVSYSAAFTSEDASGTQYTISLTRTTDTSAPSSTCTLPAPFTITSPVASTSFSRATGDIVIAYSGSGQTDPMSWNLSGSCIVPATGTVADDSGTITIAHGSLTVPSGSNAAQGNCALTFTLSRTRAGTLDPAYQGGTISALQTRTLQIQSTP